MTEITTTAQAADSPTQRGTVTDATGAPPRPGVIPDNAYENLPEADRSKYSRVRAGPDGESIWQERSTLQSETDPAAKTATGDAATTQPAVTADGKLKVGDYELSSDDIATLLQQKAAAELRPPKFRPMLRVMNPNCPRASSFPTASIFASIPPILPCRISGLSRRRSA